MNKPYIVCHMMTSVDGRIDCAMTEHLPGVQEYYNTLDALDAPTRISGRVTAELEMALPESLSPRPPKRSARRPFPRPPTPRATRSSSTPTARSSGTRAPRTSARCSS